MAVVDASVYVALIHAEESGHEQSWAWIEASQERGEKLWAPAILAPEVGSAISRGSQNAELAEHIVRQLLGAQVVELVPVSLQLAGRAATIATEHGLRGCDAIYVALAERLDEPLVTYDRQQLERTAELIGAHRPGDPEGPPN